MVSEMGRVRRRAGVKKRQRQEVKKGFGLSPMGIQIRINIYKRVRRDGVSFRVLPSQDTDIYICCEEILFLALPYQNERYKEKKKGEEGNE